MVTKLSHNPNAPAITENAFSSIIQAWAERKNQSRQAIRQLLCLLFTVFAAMIFSQAANADDKLDVSVDKSQLYQNETLEMRVIGNIEFEFSMGSLFNLRNLDLPEPEIGDLSSDFEVLNRNQQYSVQSINGNNRAEITWTYTLAPKKAGKLTIPEITFKSAKSTPIDINVLAGKPKKGGNDAPALFLELEIDKSEAYVQEQVLVSLRLYHQGNLAKSKFSDTTSESSNRPSRFLSANKLT
jgi:hypothetical protein